MVKITKQKNSDSNLNLTIFEKLIFLSKMNSELDLGAITFKLMEDNQSYHKNNFHENSLKEVEFIKLSEEIKKEQKLLYLKIKQNQNMVSILNPDLKNNLNNIEITKENVDKILKTNWCVNGFRVKTFISLKTSKDFIEIKSNNRDDLKTSIAKGFKEYLIKFDEFGLSNFKETEKGYRNLEFAYYLIVKDCDIEMTDSFLIKQKNSNIYHFLTERFDVSDKPNKFGSYKKHVVTLSGLLDNDFHQPRTVDYLDVFNVIDKICVLKDKNKLEFFKRMVFNVVFRNQDDHAQNFSFIMNDNGEWNISPFYDVMFSYLPNGWLQFHQMTILSKFRNEEIKKETLLEIAKKAKVRKKLIKDLKIKSSINTL